MEITKTQEVLFMYQLNKLRAELEDMIECKYPYEAILKKSQELDEYIVKEMKNINIRRKNARKEMLPF